jgi:type III secretion protein N (ATPase)
VLQVVGTIIKAMVPNVNIGEFCILKTPWEDREVWTEVVVFEKQASVLTMLGE